MYEIFGQKPRSFSLSVESFEALIHPEDLDDFVAEREKALYEERDMDIEHRTKNNLNMISSLVSLKNSEIECDLSDIKHQIDTMQIIYEKLSRRDLTTVIDVGDYLQELLEQIFYSYTNRGVLIENHIEGIHTGTRVLVPLGLIVNEIATNAVKHGFTATEPPRFSIEMKETPGECGVVKFLKRIFLI